uniref:Uncharacterized protein n=1 Tax=Anguilla anguilla TaxID=7936 RepID=A0A0E9WRG9_ANGAN
MQYINSIRLIDKPEGDLEFPRVPHFEGALMCLSLFSFSFLLARIFSRYSACTARISSEVPLGSTYEDQSFSAITQFAFSNSLLPHY